MIDWMRGPLELPKKRIFRREHAAITEVVSRRKRATLRTGGGRLVKRQLD